MAAHLTAPNEAYLAGLLEQAAALERCIRRVRESGHLAASLDPLGLAAPKTLDLPESSHWAELPAALVASPLARTAASAGEAFDRLRKAYCGVSGYEFGHLRNSKERGWLHRQVESAPEAGLTPRASGALLRRLAEVENFEHFLHRSFAGQSWFSLEGCDMLVPVLDQVLDAAAAAPFGVVALGMAHRGRLNILTHILGIPYLEGLGTFLRPPALDASGREERVRLSARRLTMARRMAEANQTAAMATTYNEVDMRAIVDLRLRKREAFKKKHGADLGYMSFFVKAAVQALQEFPSLNAELQDEELVLKRSYDIGIAVGLEEGLVVPVLRDCAGKSFAQSGIADLAQRAKERKLGLDDLRGGTFTITNDGMFGSMWSTPILNLPQTGILGMHKIEERPVVRDGQIVIRPMMYLALTYDHRVVEGREAVLCLARIKEALEDPAAMLLGL